MHVDLVLKNCKLVTPRGITEAGIAIDKGKIVAVSRTPHLPNAEKTLDLNGDPVLPGVLDGHCHATSIPDTPASTTKAATHGGITTIHDMPGYEIPCFNLREYTEKQSVFKDNCYVDYTMHGACASGYPPKDLIEMWKNGATGIKFFVSDPGPGWPQTSDGEILNAFRNLAKINGLALIHAENDGIIKDNHKRLKSEKRTDYSAYLEERPKIAEEEAGRRIIQYLEATRCRGVIAHTSIPETVKNVVAARTRGVKIHTETCPQYLYLTDEDVKEKGPWVKFAPPPRSKETVAQMRKLLANGYIDTVATDHAPFTKEEKQIGDIDMLEVPNGIPGLDTFMPLLVNAVSEGWLTLSQLANVVSEKPAKLYGVYPRKGSFQPGSDADLVVLDLDRKHVIRDEDQYTLCGWTPYDGMEIKGMPRLSIMRGRVIMDEGEVLAEKGYGQHLPRIN
ncbi:amidohydrolase family protein [Candidatus Bathyarchaeota archaeon]|nr:amidohydrolase family protein [Candidatus Bathyarchaeota archaeon]